MKIQDEFAMVTTRQLDAATLEAGAAASLLSPGEADASRDQLSQRHNDVTSHESTPVLEREGLSGAVIVLREWGHGHMFPLRAPQHSKESVRSALRFAARRERAIAGDGIEISYEGELWRIKDSGLANLKQDGRSTREATLTPGTEVTIAGRTYVAESERSIALRNFCFRLLGYARFSVVDQALRAIHLSCTGRAPERVNAFETADVGFL
jgi:hypothetical protein